MTSTLTPQSPGEFQATHQRSLLSRLNDLWSRAWFAYLTIFALQLRVMWNIWQYRDLTMGDTSRYFTWAWQWFARGKTHLAMSPLYTVFYGSLLSLTQDAHSVTVLHRMAIVLIGTCLVLAVMRRILPASAAWLVAMWWAILPVNFNALYEVHQFALLPILLGWLVALRKNPGPWTRGWVLAIFVAATLFVRNEMIAPSACFALFCLWHEWCRRREHNKWSAAGTIFAYAVPLALLGPIVGWFCKHSDASYSDFRAEFHQRITLNMVQTYAYGYQQRHPEWDHDPWTEGEALCQRDFGEGEPSVWLMAARNPAALAQHMLWNLKLVPSGVQLLLFDAASGSVNPDYVQVRLNSTQAYWESVAVAAVLAIALLIFLWERRKWLAWFGASRLGWEAMISVALMAIPIILTQRPRPSYLFGLSVFMMAVVGSAGWIIASHLPALKWNGLAMTAIMVVPLFLTRSEFQSHTPERTELWQLYERLRPFGDAFAKPDCVFLANRYAGYIAYYLGLSPRENQTLVYNKAFADWGDEQTLEAALDGSGASLFYLDNREAEELGQTHPDFLARFFAEAGQHGWRLIGHEQNELGWWILVEKAGGRQRNVWDSPPLHFVGWDEPANFQPLEGPYPKRRIPLCRWALYPEASVRVRVKKSGVYRLSIGGGHTPVGQKLRIEVDGRVVGRREFSPEDIHEFENFEQTFELSAGEHRVTFAFERYSQQDRGSARLAMLVDELKITPTEPTTAPADR